MLYTTCCLATHSSSGVELSFSSHWTKAVSISWSKLSPWLIELSFAVWSLVGLLVPPLLCFLSYSKSHFLPQHLEIGQVGSFTLWMSILSGHLVTINSIICHCPERGCIQVVLRSSFCLNMVFVTIRTQRQWSFAMGVAFSNSTFTEDQGPLCHCLFLASH